jgi:predicted aspartyl protease
MSVRYNYNRQISPPAPFVHATVARPDDSTVSISGVAAQLDTGADFSVIPAALAEQLHVVPLDEVQVVGFGGLKVVVPTYVVSIALPSTEPTLVRMIVARDEPYVLLGRDILNHYHIILDGPQLVVELRGP